MSEALFPITWRPDHAACGNRRADPCADPSPTTCGGGGGGGGGSGGRVRCLPTAASLLLKVTILAADKVQISVRTVAVNL
jgi:hypothetical protein